MAFSTTVNKALYVGNGVTTMFAAPFLFYSTAHIEVYLVDRTTGVATLQTLTTNYTVSGTGVVTGGTVTMLVAPPSTVNLLVRRIVPQTQGVDLKEGDKFPPDTIEQTFDLAVMMAQQLAEVDSRCIKLPLGTSLSNIEIPDINLVANRGKVIKVNSSGDGFETIAVSSTDFANPLTTKGDIPVHDGISASRLPVGSDDQILIADSAQAKGVRWADSGDFAALLRNVSFAVSVGSSALTIALKTKAGTDPSATDPVYIGFRALALNNGTYNVRKITSALSIVVSSGSTLGTSNGVAARIYIGFLDNAGTVELCVWNPLTTTGLVGFGESELQTTTAEGGAGAADSAGVLYSTTARATVPFRIGGYIEITEATAGTWATTSTHQVIMGPGVRRTGDIVQNRYTSTGASATGTTVVPSDDTIPQNTEGDQYMSLAITPTNVINRLVVEAVAHLANSAAGGNIIGSLFQDSTANALASHFLTYPTAGGVYRLSAGYDMPAGTVVSTTFKFRAGGDAAGTTTFNGSGGARRMGGVMGSYMRVTEIFV